MYLVSTHAQICRVAEPLLDRALNALVEELANEALSCFRQVKRFGMGGMLRVTFFSSFGLVVSYPAIRRPLKLNSCIKHWGDMSHPPLHEPYLIFTIKFHKRTPGVQEMKTYRPIWTVLRRHLLKHVVPPGSSFYALGKQSRAPAAARPQVLDGIRMRAAVVTLERCRVRPFWQTALYCTRIIY